MSILIVQKDTEMQTGWMQVGTQSWPSIGLLPSPKAQSLHGIAFNNLTQLKLTAHFLNYAIKEIEKADKRNKKKK